MEHGHKDIVGSITTNVDMTKVWKMSGARRHIVNPGTHHGITGGFNKIGMNKQ